MTDARKNPPALTGRQVRNVEHVGLYLDGKDVLDLYETLAVARSDIREADRLLDSSVADRLDEWLNDLRWRIDHLREPPF